MRPWYMREPVLSRPFSSKKKAYTVGGVPGVLPGIVSLEGL